MRSIRVAPVALLGAALALTVPAAIASAASSGGASSATGYTVTPSVIAPGGQVTLAARGCSATATAGSGVFDTVTIPGGGSAAATVDWDAKPGSSHEVTFICSAPPGSTAKVRLTVAAASRAPTAGSAVAPAGVRGGLGGGGPSTAELVAGTVLAVAAATGAVHMARRHGENRPR
ncbi:MULTISPECIES: hypothetical protein [unclassified Streptomyces]|uniref:hypothetical protein n=1 Tax=unclassified Streptomyces TaxID=2593676 RepID=UPI0011E66C9F|nr:hypothetical protein [Streptomyces sp. sk2.1]TXS71602.1 hypothetical protein EAO76_21095 [Streptomyces sp. sk2.1]